MANNDPIMEVLERLTRLETLQTTACNHLARLNGRLDTQQKAIDEHTRKFDRIKTAIVTTALTGGGVAVAFSPELLRALAALL